MTESPRTSANAAGLPGARTAAETVVIGGGVMGLSIAFHLSRKGVRDVVVLEKASVGAGESGKSTAVLRQHYSHGLTARMAKHGIGFFASDFRILTGSDPGFKRTGMLIVGGPRQAPALARNVERLVHEGIETKLLTAEELRRVSFDAAWPDGTVAAYEPEAGYVNPWAVLKGLDAACRRSGVELRDEAATGIIVKGGRVAGVRTRGGMIPTRTVVLAAGPWSASLARTAKLVLPLEVTRPQVGSYFFGDTRGRGLIFADLARNAYWLPNPGGLTLVGSLDLKADRRAKDPDRAGEAIEPAMIAEYRRRVQGRVPSFSAAISRGGYSALYTLSPDLLPLLGSSPIEGLVLAVGFSGHGFKLAPAVGLALSELIAEGAAHSFDITPFEPTRFTDGRRLKTQFSNVLA